MTRLTIPTLFILLAANAQAAPIEEACSARGTWDTETCECMQGVADDMFEADQQETVAKFFARQITSQQIMAAQGVEAAQAFLQSIADFMGDTTFKCGAP